MDIDDKKWSQKPFDEITVQRSLSVMTPISQNEGMIVKACKIIITVKCYKEDIRS